MKNQLIGRSKLIEWYFCKSVQVKELGILKQSPPCGTLDVNIDENCHYMGTLKMISVLNQAKFVSKMAWLAFGINILGFGLKTLQIFRVGNLAVHKWYHEKLEQEILTKYHTMGLFGTIFLLFRIYRC